jgi:hypothetical protein
MLQTCMSITDGHFPYGEMTSNGAKKFAKCQWNYESEVIFPIHIRIFPYVK